MQKGARAANTVRAAGLELGSASVLAVILAGNAFAAVGIGPPPPPPEAGNIYVLYAGIQEEYDGNLYRLPDVHGIVANLVSPNASVADSITTGSVGIDAQHEFGRQTVLADIHLDESRFAHNTTLNNTSGYGKLHLNWQVGPYFSGTAGANYSRTLVNFGEALFLGRDLLDTTDYFGTARYQVGPQWALYGGLDDASVQHSAVAARAGDFHSKGGQAGVEYALTPTDTFGLEYRYTENRFPPGEVFTISGITFSPNFHEDTALFLVKHAFSDKTQLSANVGYQKRLYPNTLIGAFSGNVWRLSLDWQPTEKTQINFATWHELHAYLVSQSNYFISKGGSIKPTWLATEKFSVSMLFSYEKQNYIPESTSVVALGPLNAKVAVEQVAVNYSPRSSWTMSLSYTHARRDSNAQSFRYGDDLANFSVLYKTH